MPRLPGAVQCLRGEGRGAARRAELPALLLPPLRSAGANLPAVRPRQYLLRRRVLAGGTPRVYASRRYSLPTYAPWGPSPCRTATPLLSTPERSDASGMCKHHRRLQGVDRYCDRERIDRCLRNPLLQAAGHLRVLRSSVAALRTAASMAMERMSDDLSRARGRDLAAVSRRALARGHGRPATSRSPLHGTARADAGGYPCG